MTKDKFLKIPGVKDRLEKLATKHGFTVDEILTVIQKESGFKTTAENPKSKATGLIQFMPDTAKGLGTTIEKIKEMDALAQLEIVDKYFTQNHTKGQHPYVTVAYPAAAKMDMDDIVAPKDSIIAKQNPVWQDKDGNVTKRSILGYVGAEDRDNKSEQEEFPGLLPEVEIKEDSQDTGKKKYRKDVLDRISGRDEYLKYLEDNQDAFKELSVIDKNLKSFSKGTKEYNDLEKRKNELIKDLTKKENILKEDLYKKELNNYVNSENNAREQLSKLQNEAKGYIDAGEEVPADITKGIAEARETISKSGNRVKILVKQDWNDYDISPVQQGYNQNILLPDGTIDIEKSKTTPILPDPLSDDKEEDIVYNVVDENTDQTQIIETPETETITEDVVEETVGVEDSVIETEDPTTDPNNTVNQLGNAGKALFQGAGKVLDYVGGVGGILSYVMGKKGLKEAMKEVKPHASAQLSPMFMQHLRQSREIAKKGFHPDQARVIQKEMDGAYQKGLENAVRGSSGILDAQRSSALLDYAAKDSELQTKNQEKHDKLMLFKENFDIQQTEKERAEDMERQVANKKSAATFTSAAFTNLMAGFGGSSSLLNKQNTSNIYNTIEGFMKNTGDTGTDNN